jgi:hydrogenase nickel incorporation protein HypA/HybF
MHELAIAEGVLEIVEATARRNAAKRVATVWLELGALSHVEARALAFCFDAVTRGSLAEGATLEIVTLSGEAWCMPCGDRVPLQRHGEPCPRCGSFQLEVVRGEEMRVKEIAIA